jgi:hypothetical protein
MVAAIIAKLQTHTPAQRGALTLSLAPEGFPRQKAQRLQFSHEFSIE